MVPTCTPLASKTSQECVNAGFVAATVATVGVSYIRRCWLVSKTGQIIVRGDGRCCCSAITSVSRVTVSVTVSVVFTAVTVWLKPVAPVSGFALWSLAAASVMVQV